MEGFAAPRRARLLEETTHGVPASLEEDGDPQPQLPPPAPAQHPGGCPVPPLTPPPATAPTQGAPKGESAPADPQAPLCPPTSGPPPGGRAHRVGRQ